MGFHDWKNDCEKCAKCGKSRVYPHDWSKNCERCANCNQTSGINHDWNGENCTKCGMEKSTLFANELQIASLKAIQLQLLDLSDLLAQGPRLSYEEKREKYLRQALKPVSAKWGYTVDELLPLVKG